MSAIMLSHLSVIFFLLLAVLPGVQTFFISHHIAHISNRWTRTYDSMREVHVVTMSSVSDGVGPKPTPPPRSVGFIISPSLNSEADEMLILQNFNQIQQGESKKMGIIGTQDLTENHRTMVELLSYALVLSGNHIYTSGGGNGTNCAVIKGALRACNPDLLTVILPQSLFRQPADMQSLLLRVANLIQQPEYDDLDLKTAANLCNEKLLSKVCIIPLSVFFVSLCSPPDISCQVLNLELLLDVGLSVWLLLNSFDVFGRSIMYLYLRIMSQALSLRPSRQ